MKRITVDMTSSDYDRGEGILPTIIRECCTKIGFSDNEVYNPEDIEVVFIIANNETSFWNRIRNWFTLWRFRYEMHLMCKVGIIVKIVYTRHNKTEVVNFNRILN